MKKDCDAKLEDAAREHAEKLAAAAKDHSQWFNALQADTDSRLELLAREHTEKLGFVN